MSRRLIPYPVYRWVGDRIVGRVLLYGFKREMERGDVHEARHISVAIQTGNSQDCDAAHCRLDHSPVRLTVPAYRQEPRGSST